MIYTLLFTCQIQYLQHNTNSCIIFNTNFTLHAIYGYLPNQFIVFFQVEILPQFKIFSQPTHEWSVLQDKNLHSDHMRIQSNAISYHSRTVIVMHRLYDVLYLEHKRLLRVVAC